MGQVESRRRASGIFKSSSRNSLSSMTSRDEENGIFMEANESTKENLMYGRKTPCVDEREVIVNVEDDLKYVVKHTTLEHDVETRKEAVHKLVHKFTEEKPLPVVSSYMPSILSDAIFCGHLVTDLDSIAGAIGAAELYGGIPARASNVNSETRFALSYWGVSEPLPIEDLVVSQPTAGICLVDHQQMSQVNPIIDPDRIVGVIDHHALQNSTIVTERAIYIDIRPWGSMSTIIAHTYMVNQKKPRKCVAGMLLCAILSDTLNLQGPTTTQWDRLMVAVLCELCNVVDINELAVKQFRAKSKELECLTAAQLVEGDLKVFSFKTELFTGVIGFAVIETTDDDVILSKKDELLEHMYSVKAAKSLNLFFLSIVNIVKLHSNVLLIGRDERSLAFYAFPPLIEEDIAINDSRCIEGEPMLTEPYPLEKEYHLYEKHMCHRDSNFNLLYLGNRVSRKLNYVPAITRVINKDGWSVPE